MISPDIQNYFDGEAFDPESGYVELTKRDEKIRHIHLHVAKAAMKLALHDERKIVEEVIPDVAIYRSQLINLVGTDNFENFSAIFPYQSDLVVPENSLSNSILEQLVVAGGSLATYIERKEHGRPADDYNLVEAAIDLHEVAIDLGQLYGVDVDNAHIQRLESLMGRALPADISK